jgi:quinol monooxygenase YgiN/mannose-6-phosphate isomerase-like protein (cupin superfamily)
MTKIARYGRAQAKPGQGGALADLLLTVADSLRATPGCELYMINQAVDDPDTIWITEQWSDEAAMKAALAAAAEDGPKPADALALVEPGQWQMTELKPLGGVGVPEPAPGHTKLNLGETEDMAAKHGFGEMGESRFPNEELGLGPIGLSHHRMRAGRRQPFGHRHQRAEEVYVVLSGHGRAKVGDEVFDVGPLDAIRVSPHEPRAFEGSETEELELLAFGQRFRGDAEMLPDWWTD